MAVPANELMDDSAVAHLINLMRYDAGERRSVLKILRQLEQIIAARLLAENTEFNLRRLRALRDSVYAMIDSAYGELSESQLKALEGLASAEGRSAVRGINNVVKADLATVYVSPATLKAIANTSMIEGAPSSVWWKRQREAVKRRFIDTVRMGMLQGQTNQQIVRAVRDNVFPWQRRAAEALVRTSIMAVSNNSRLRAYEVNKSVVKGVRAVVTLDTRTTRLCMSRSGMAWDMDGKPMNAETNIPFPGPPPWHYNCRTTLSAVLKSWEELGASKKIKEIDPGTRASMDGQVAADMTYEQWLKKKDAAEPGFAKSVLGPGRYNLWKNGKLTLRDLVDQRGRELTLEQLDAKS